jgi:hypothetical protein
MRNAYKFLYAHGPLLAVHSPQNHVAERTGMHANKRRSYGKGLLGNEYRLEQIQFGESSQEILRKNLRNNDRHYKFA